MTQTDFINLVRVGPFNTVNLTKLFHLTLGGLIFLYIKMSFKE